MAISPISPGDTDARVKMNAAIAKANEVDDKASASGLAAEAEARAAAIASLQTQINSRATVGALGAANEDRSAADNALSVRIDSRATYAEVVAEHHRPGEPGSFSTSDIAGSPEAVALLEGSKAVSATNGSVVAIRAGYVAPISVRRIEPGRQYRLRFVVQRAEDTSDPANDAIRFGIAWLKADKSQLSDLVIANVLDVQVSSGRLEFLYIVSRADGDAVDVVSPAGAVYARPFVRCYGSGLTYVEVIEWTDLSNAIDWSPDVSEFRNALAGVDQRLGSAEGQIDSLADNLATHIESVSRASYGIVSADEDFTVSATSDARLIRHTATLTATRQASLITPGAQAGSVVRIVRSGSGAFPLNVGPGLKAMAAGTWADFAFNGTAWFVTASGTL